VDVELPLDGFARDLDLELLGDMGFVEGAAASIHFITNSINLSTWQYLGFMNGDEVVDESLLN
jgi:hypothetical protein